MVSPPFSPPMLGMFGDRKLLDEWRVVVGHVGKYEYVYASLQTKAFFIIYGTNNSFNMLSVKHIGHIDFLDMRCNLTIKYRGIVKSTVLYGKR